MPFDRGASHNSRRHRERLAERPTHCRVTRFRQGKKNEWKDPKEEVVYLIASLEAGEAAPEALLCANRGHWGIEIMHRNKDVILGEDACTNRSDNAPRNIFSLIGFALKS
jgi:predicted transposase YbfD/YdcC